jgi:hypothetical protein
MTKGLKPLAMTNGLKPLAMTKHIACPRLFLGRAKAACALYLRYKGHRVEKAGKLWEEAIPGDLKEFEKRGLKHWPRGGRRMYAWDKEKGCIEPREARRGVRCDLRLRLGNCR